MRRRTWLLGIAGAAAAMLVGAGVLMAQSDEPNASGTSFLDRVAGKLGIGSDKLEQAVHDARVDQINERVASGDLTQAEADELIQHLDDMPADAPFLGPGPGGEFGFRGGDHAFGFHFDIGGIGAGVDGEALATFLGITTDQLHQELTADNATLASVAEAHGKSRDELKSFILDTADQRLATAVTNGDLTQTEADNIKSKLEAMVDDMIDNTLPRDAPFGGPGPGGEFGFFKGGDHGFGFGFGIGGGIGAGVDGEALATFLGISTDQLHQELTADNATLASVAEAHGKSRDDLKSFILDTANQRLATAVTNGDLTQTQADNIKSKLEAMVDDMIDNNFPGKGRFHFHMEGNGDDDVPAPQGSAVPATPGT